LADAFELTRRDASAAAAFRRQIEFDNRLAEDLNRVALSDAQVDALERLLSESTPTMEEKAHPEATAKVQPSGQVQTVEQQRDEEEEPPKRARPTTILLAVGIGLIATICLLVYVASEQMSGFSGSDRVSALLETANTLTGDEFEPVETSAGELKDWFFLKHNLERYAVPKSLADFRTIGCRVFKFNGADVAQIMAVGDKELLFFIFPSNEVGVKIPSDQWQIVEGENWVGGLTGMDDTCFLVAFRGTKDEMKEFLAKRPL
jgi:hypothetical protein